MDKKNRHANINAQTYTLEQLAIRARRYYYYYYYCHGEN